MLDKPIRRRLDHLSLPVITIERVIGPVDHDELMRDAGAVERSPVVVGVLEGDDEILVAVEDQDRPSRPLDLFARTVSASA